MGELIFVPIELLRERYSEQWFNWFTDAFRKEGIKTLTVGSTAPRRIGKGQFLDIYDTNIFKTDQLNKILRLIKKGWEGTIFFLDLWFPGIEALAYIRDADKRRIRIEGLLHAGTWDMWDFLSQSGCEKWGRDIENGWLKLIDKIYVATEYHKELIRQSRNPVSEIEVVDWPCYKNEGLRNTPKEDIVVFPHRLAIEKRPEDFRILERIFRKETGDYKSRFIMTKETCKTKKEYYALLSKSKVAFSSALQETFGIAMVEAWNLGAIPVCPDRLSYKETMSGWNRYKTLEEAASIVAESLKKYHLPHPSRYGEDVGHIVRRIEV